jgi:hypothetical protein
MNFTLLLVGLIAIILGGLIVYFNPEPLIVSLGPFEIYTSKGVSCISTFGFGLLTGVIAMMTRDIPRMRRLRGIDVELEE